MTNLTNSYKNIKQNIKMWEWRYGKKYAVITNAQK